MIINNRVGRDNSMNYPNDEAYNLIELMPNKWSYLYERKHQLP